MLEAAWRDDTEDLGWGWDDAVSPEEETYRLELVAEEAALQD